MSLADVCAFLILVGLTAYIALAGADFGAPLWAALARGKDAEAIRNHTHEGMAPVWEANHVWLIFVFVVTWTAFPVVFGSVMSTLAVPLFIAAIGIIVRGTSYVVSSIKETRATGIVFALSSVITPFALGAALGGIAAGEVPIGNAQGDLFSSWLNPTSILVGVLAVALSAYLSAVYLAGDGARRGAHELAEAFRRRGLAAGALAGAIALGGLAVLSADADDLYEGLNSGAGLAAVIISGLAGIGTITLLYKRRFEPARFGAVLAVAAIVVGWAIAQSPDVIPGQPIDQAAASHSTLVALLISIGAGLLVLIPSLVLLFGLVLKGRFDDEPEEITEVDVPAGGGRKPRAAVVVALGVIGVPLTVFSNGGLLLGLGVIFMLVFTVAAFLLLADDPASPPAPSA